MRCPVCKTQIKETRERPTAICTNATGLGDGYVESTKVVSYPRPDYPTCEEMDSMYQEHLIEDAKDIEFELKKGRKE